MGLLFSKIKLVNRSKSISSNIIKEYSWERKNRLSSDNFVIQKLENDEEYRYPGTVNGEQIIIQYCNNSSVFILDLANTITIDDCAHCKIITGPAKRSIFVRECQDCTIIVACEQFRVRDCENLTISLYCPTQPIIESSNNIRFTCYQLYYEHIQEHFHQCNLNVWNNTWYKIHDYTPSNYNDAPNWSYEESRVDSWMATDNSLKDEIVKLDPANSIVPLTYGQISKVDNCHDSNCLVVFCDEFSVKIFLTSLIYSQSNVILIRSRQFTMTTQHAESLFLTSAFIKAVQYGPIIGLHMYGENALTICTKIIEETLETTLYYVSPTSNIACHQVNTFFGFVDV